METVNDLLLSPQTGRKRPFEYKYQIHARHEQGFFVYVPDRHIGNDLPPATELELNPGTIRH